jgi:phospholipid transport system substrate-binding protein
MKIYFGVVVLLSTLLLAPTTWAAVTGPDTLVDNTAQEVLTIIRQDKGIKPGRKARLLNLVEAKILPHFDFNHMTRLAMGKIGLKLHPGSSRK